MCRHHACRIQSASSHNLVCWHAGRRSMSLGRFRGSKRCWHVAVRGRVVSREDSTRLDLQRYCADLVEIAMVVTTVQGG